MKMIQLHLIYRLLFITTFLLLVLLIDLQIVRGFSPSHSYLQESVKRRCSSSSSSVFFRYESKSSSSAAVTTTRMKENEEQDDDGDKEKCWRHVKKPLLRVGSKGATLSHGNSLRQLLNDHTAVKVKVNTKKFGTLDDAFRTLRDLAVESGASKDIELIQMRESDRMILFGLPGTLQRIKDGTFPPAVVAASDDGDGDSSEE